MTESKRLALNHRHLGSSEEQTHKSQEDIEPVCFGA